MNRISVDRADIAAGLVFLAFGVFFAVQSIRLDMGTMLKMGPGYFPFVLSGLLILLGIAVIVGGVRSGGEPIGRIALRGMLFILPAPIVFGLTVKGLGFVPAIFCTTLIACFAAKTRPIQALALAAGVTVFSTLVFVWGLGLPFRPLGTLFDALPAG